MPKTSRFTIWTLFGAVAALALGAACGGSGAAPSADVWAEVDDRQILRDEVEKAYRRAIDPSTPPQSEDEMMTVKLNLVEELINQEILLERARGLNLEVTAAELDAGFNERKGNISDDAFARQLGARGVTSDDLREALRRELLIEKLVDQEVDSKIAVTDEEISAYYNKNRAQFNVPETQYRIAQIVVTPAREAQLANRLSDDAATPADAQRKAQMLMDRIKSGGDFAELARDYSEDPQSAPLGGDLGFVSETALQQVPANLRNAVLRSEPGNVNLVSAGGAHTLVMLVAREAAGQRELSTPAVKDSITTLIRQRREQLWRSAYLAAARNDVKVVNHIARQLAESQAAALPSLTPSAPGK